MPAYDFKVTNELFEWRGPSPFHFVEIGNADSEVIKRESKVLSYGWGVIPIHGRVGKMDFTSALIPKDGKYLIPIKDAVRKGEDLEIGDNVTVTFNLGRAK